MALTTLSCNMRVGTQLLVRLKTLMANFLVSRPMAWLVRMTYRTHLPSMGIAVSIPRDMLDDRTRALIAFGLYERAEIEFVRRFLPVGTDVVEVGASVGIVSAHIAACLSPDYRLVAIEANSELRSVWESVMGPSTGRHLLVNVAIGPADCPHTELWVAEDPLCSRTVGPVTATGKVVRVEQTSLASVLSAYGVSHDYFLVADIEGAEAAFIVGQDLRALAGCMGMVIELHDTAVNGKQYTRQRLRQDLTAVHGFEVIAERGPVLALRRYGG